jgi:hypothetical protein
MELYQFTKKKSIETGYEDVVRIYLAEDRNRWWAPANEIKNLRVP